MPVFLLFFRCRELQPYPVLRLTIDSCSWWHCRCMLASCHKGCMSCRPMQWRDYHSNSPLRRILCTLPLSHRLYWFCLFCTVAFESAVLCQDQTQSISDSLCMPVYMSISADNFGLLQPVRGIIGSKYRVAIENQRYAGDCFDFCDAHVFMPRCWFSKTLSFFRFYCIYIAANVYKKTGLYVKNISQSCWFSWFVFIICYVVRRISHCRRLFSQLLRASQEIPAFPSRFLGRLPQTLCTSRMFLLQDWTVQSCSILL